MDKQITSNIQTTSYTSNDPLIEHKLKWLINYVQKISNELTKTYYKEQTLNDIINKKHTGKGKVAAQSLGWTHLREGNHNTRIDWIAKAQVFSLLSAQAEKKQIYDLLKQNPELNNDKIIKHAKNAKYLTINHLRKRIHNWDGELPDNFITFSKKPVNNKIVRLGIVDKQLLKNKNVNNNVVSFDIRLPVNAQPQSSKDWEWVDLNIIIPDYVRSLHNNPEKFSNPNIRIKDNGSLVFDIAISETVDVVLKQKRALGVDWSPSLGVVSGIVDKDSTGVLSSGFDKIVPGDDVLHIIDKQSDRLRKSIELKQRINRIKKLTPNSESLKILEKEYRFLSNKRARVNRQLAWLLASHVVDTALENNCDLVVLEDLRSIGGKFSSKNNNASVSQSPRGLIRDAIFHTANRNGLSVVIVPAKDTSARCNRCDSFLVRPAGYYSASCSNGCFNTCDRDVIGAVNVGKRGLLGNVNSKSRVGKVVHSPVVRRVVSRDKVGPTPKQRKRVNHKVKRLVNRNVNYNVVPFYAVGTDHSVPLNGAMNNIHEVVDIGAGIDPSALLIHNE